jgi:hypothetical protein
MFSRLKDLDGEKDVLVKENVSVDCWNELLLKNHLLKEMLWFDEGKVRIILYVCFVLSYLM